MPSGTFSILGRIVVVETIWRVLAHYVPKNLSVSSDGSWWLKQWVSALYDNATTPFSILGRIVVVETFLAVAVGAGASAFSILGRIVVVETFGVAMASAGSSITFSILGRIVVVETYLRASIGGIVIFQYPRTDRGG